MVFSYGFPVTQSSTTGGTGNLGVSVGSYTVPPGSQDSNKSINCSVPVAFQFTGNDSTGLANTFTVSNMNITGVCNVWRNGVFLQTITATKSNSITTKAFSKTSASGAFSLISYFWNVNFTFTPPVSANTYTYEFFIPLTFTLNGTSSVTTSSNPGCFANLSVDTTTTTHSFSANISYSSSSDTTGYIAYYLTDSILYNNVWNAGSGSGYIPTYPNTSWNGLQECDVIYSNKQYIAGDVNFKNTGFNNTIRWLNNDANSASDMGSITIDRVGQSMNFISNLTNGFSFSGAVNFLSDVILNLATFTTANITTANIATDNVTSLIVSSACSLPHNTVVSGSLWSQMSGSILRRRSLTSVGADTTFSWSTLVELIIVNGSYDVVLPNPSSYPNPYPYATNAEGIYVLVMIKTTSSTVTLKVSGAGNTIRLGSSNVSSYSFTDSGTYRQLVIIGTQWCVLRDV
jgi:hypothetical protein